MRSRLAADLLVHSQLFMAFSGACFVTAVSLLLVGAVPSPVMLLASTCGILSIHLFDSVRSANLEDLISQPCRAKLFRDRPLPVLVLSIALLILTGIALLYAGTRLWVLACFSLLGLLAACYVFPVLSLFPADKKTPDSLKDLARLKPVLISFAWFSGACLVVLGRPLTEEVTPGLSFLGLLICAFPWLLLDSIWLDRRDRIADESYHRMTFAVRLSAGSFRTVCVVLYLFPLLGAFFPGDGFHGFMIGGFIGALPMILLTPDQIRSEAMRVVVAGLWRVTSLLGILTFLA